MTEQSKWSRENKQSTKVAFCCRIPFKIYDICSSSKQVEQIGYTTWIRLSIIQKIAFAWEFLVITCTATQWTHPPHARKKNQPILVRVLSAYQTFFAWNFVNRLKQTFLQINPFVACRHRARTTSATIDWFVEIERRVRFLAPCGSRIVKFLIHD